MSKSLDKNKYIELKNLAYFVYDIYSKSSSSKAESLMLGFLDKYESLEEKQIFANTLKFPYDVDLCQFLSGNKFSNDNIILATEKFKISEELIKQKAIEYVKYSYLQSVSDGMIDYSVINPLSYELLKKSCSSEKNTKLS